MAVSISFKVAKRTDIALFVGPWAAPFLILGIYNKLVKIHCSDSTAGAYPKLRHALLSLSHYTSAGSSITSTVPQ